MVDIVVTVRQGALRGLKDITYKGDTFYSFKGIPYAKPPLGKLRFRAPQPPEPWKGILDATKHKDKCIQPDLSSQQLIGSEDCLYLNVYTLEDPRETNGKAKPVMVWIHGGGFVVGSGHTDEYGPDYLVTEGVILVTFNYRLGICGFLKADDPSVGIPGNAGMKDMVLALKWVKENISRFGGDANNVTIFGESAGGTSVHYLTLSPLAKGLFHQAIIISGSVLNMGAFVNSDIKLFQGLAKVLNVTSQNEKEIVREIEKLSSEELHQAQLKLKSVIGGDIMPFAPSIEKPSKEPAFLLDHPLNLLKSGNFHQVPIIFGYTSREGMLMALLGEKLIQSDYEVFVPFNLGLTKGSPKSVEIAEKIGQFFYGDEKPSLQNTDIAFTIYSDIGFLNGIYSSIKEIIKASSENIYWYRFSLDGKTTLLKSMLKLTLPGTCHGDDLVYLFRMEKVPLKVNPGSVEDIAIKRYTKLLTNFAKYGNPNSKPTTDLINVEWKPVRENEFNFLELGENLTVGLNPDWKRIKFWEKILNS